MPCDLDRTRMIVTTDTRHRAFDPSESCPVDVVAVGLFRKPLRELRKFRTVLAIKRVVAHAPPLCGTHFLKCLGTLADHAEVFGRQTFKDFA